ncbi:MAG: hypothetical protein MJ133_01085 [Lachnospiraceae bacterium]|nr:hypothetical protein [Lachnospiraceae bacterium]
MINRIEKFFSEKKILVISVVFLVVLLIPILYLAPIDMATGDDYGYGIVVKRAIDNGDSLITILGKVNRQIVEIYNDWQGTWFSVFLFSFNPAVFSEKAYFVVPFIMMLSLMLGILYLVKAVLGNVFGFDKVKTYIISLLFFIVSIEFVYSTASAIYWYNGGMHYTVPYAMCLFLIAFSIHYVRTYRVKYYIGVLILATLLGGSNYLASILSLVSLVFVIVYSIIINTRKRRPLLLIFPIAIESIGLIVSMLAPGNKVRGGEEFGFSFSKIIYTIFKCFGSLGRDLLKLLTEKTIVVFILAVIFCLLLGFFAHTDWIKIRYPGILVAMMICVSAAVYAPNEFVTVDVSGGVPNTEYWVMIAMLLGIEVVASSIISKSVKFKWSTMILTILVCFLSCLLVKGQIKDSTSYKAYEYIKSGEAADYKRQMDEQTRILKSDEANVIVEPINDVQGPLVHMPISDDPTAWTNRVVAEFYGKESVVAAIDEEENQ